MIHQLIMTAIGVYFILMAIPFMPGVEIGLSMMLFFGSQICFLVYVTTVAALTLSYSIGYFVSVRYLIIAFSYVGFTRAERLVRRIAPLTVDERLVFFMQITPSGITPFLVRHRLLALAVLLNLPGNLLIGGGGELHNWLVCLACFAFHHLF